MTPVAFLIAAAAVTWLGLLASLALGAYEALVPALGLVLTVATARWAQRPWHRPVALTLGLIEGLVIPGGWFLVAAGMLIIASLARVLRALWLRERPPLTILTGFVMGMLFDGGMRLLLPPSDAGGWPRFETWTVLVGAFLGGLLLGFVETVIVRSPRLRRLLERN